jgi:hypothetical protein
VAEADPSLAPGEGLCYVGDRHIVNRNEFRDESGLFENGERFVFRQSHQIDDALGFLLAQGNIRHALDAEFGGAALAFETVQQHTPMRRVDAP